MNWDLDKTLVKFGLYKDDLCKCSRINFNLVNFSFTQYYFCHHIEQLCGDSPT